MMRVLHPYVLVLAGTAAQAAEWMRAEGLTPACLRYVSSAAGIRGSEMDVPFVVTGTFWDRHDAIQIWETLMQLQTVRAKAPDHIEPFLEHNKKQWVETPPVARMPAPPTPPEPEPDHEPKTFKHIKEAPPKKKTFKKIHVRP